ncbi:hypothetical protein R50073_43070 [Maricurvus nonylphenolicus]|uniref:hypothetical protein n=1 Tax=Maricurvus nonylphenolicus TaxID=1008307 RepID=UPI0036F3C7D4
MKIVKAGLLSTLLLYGSMVAAADSNGHVKGRVPDQTSGRMLGGWSGFLVGGAAGGIAGAIAMGLAGLWMGGEVQESAGLAGDAYEVELADGEQVVIRSPNRQWQTGDAVAVKGNRLVAQQ